MEKSYIIRLQFLIVFLLLVSFSVAEFFDLEEASTHLDSLNVYDDFGSIDGSQVGELDLRSKFKRMFGVRLFDGDGSKESKQSAASHIDYMMDESETQVISDALGSYHDYIQLEGWEVQNLRLYPGSVYGFNFSIDGNDQGSALTFVSANICRYPDSLNTSDALQYLNFYVSSNKGVEQAIFDEGYYQTQNWEFGTSITLTTLIYVEVQNTTDINSLDYFQLQFAVSTNDLVFQWDKTSFASLIDTDGDSAFFETEVFSLTGSSLEAAYNSTADYKINVFKDETANYFTGLSKSFCALNSQAGLIPEENIVTSYEAMGSNFRKQFAVRGLNSSSSYVAYITKQFNGTNNGGVAYSRTLFETEAEGICKLIYGLEFCDKVAYSVPQSAAYQLDGNETALKELYDSYPKAVYQNFSKAMEQIDCYSTDDVIFSPIASCGDCRDSYKNWLCAVTIPRCTGTARDKYVLRKSGESRNDYLNDVVHPVNDYYEILPCIDMCWSLVQSCPPDFSFSCPVDNTSLLQSYQYHEKYNYTTCNLFGNKTALSAASRFPKVDIKILLSMLGLVLSLI